MKEALSIGNCQPVPFNDVPCLAIERFRTAVVEAVRQGLRLVSLFGFPADPPTVDLLAVLADDQAGQLFALRTQVGDSYPALTPDCPSAQAFERELAEQWGVVPQGHPWLKPLRFHPSYRLDHDAWGRDRSQAILPGVTDYYAVGGSEAHEVAVGPVHAGIIEPGHFRFQCHGEIVFHLEIALGYQHRGLERRLAGLPADRALHLMETAAGDTTIGHTLAYCQLVEALSAQTVSLHGHAVRGILLELERLANHTGDLGALAGDIAYLPTAAYCGRLRGDFLNLTALVCGSRFGRGALKVGGVNFDINEGTAQTLLTRLAAAYNDLACASTLLWETPSVLDRFEAVGKLSAPLAHELGLVGVAARASGVDCDVRRDFPFGIFRAAQITVSTFSSGDVFARAFVRWLEAQRSVQFIEEQAGMLGKETATSERKTIATGMMVVSLVEGWRGEIAHTAITDREGRFLHYKIVDPSFHNWLGLSMVMRNQQISDFPLCNKSFNLSYCGHDL